MGPALTCRASAACRFEDDAVGLPAKLQKLMSYTGTVKGGFVKLPPGACLPDGTAVRVEPILPAPISGNELTRRLRQIAATQPDLPADMAAQHDHYLHGTAKR